MEILIVTPSYYPIVGGGEALTQTLAIKLNQKGIHTDVMTLNMKRKWHPIWRNEVEDNGVHKIFRMSAINPFSVFTLNPSYLLSRVNVIPRFSFKEKLEEYDVIHFLGEADLSFPLLSYSVRKPKIIHCVATRFLLGYYQRYAWLRKPFKQLFLSLANRYIVTSMEEKALLSELGVPESKLFVLPIGVDINTFCPDERMRQDSLLLFVGRIDKIKGLHILLRALYYLENSINLVIIGPRWNAKYAEEVEQVSQRINESRIHTVKILPPMNRTELVPWYQSATIVVCPYLSESYSNTTREALACGTPVISTGGHIAEEGDDGILISQKDPKKLAGAIVRLLKDKHMQKEYGRQGRKTIEKRFSWEPIIEDLSELYMEISGIRQETEKSYS